MQTIPEEIIVRSLRQTASEKEMELLNNWLKEDRKNREYYFQFQEIWQSAKKPKEILVQEGWKKLAAEIGNRPFEKTVFFSPKNKRTFFSLRYAAAVCIGILVASAVWMMIPYGRSLWKQDVVVQNVVYNRTGVQSILLPDSSEVWINDHSKVTYPETFNSERRVVSLEGKAYFDIRKNPAVPFVVEVGEVDIEVTGTEFFVESTREDRTFVTLISGRVHLKYHDQMRKGSSVPLIPGQQACIDRRKGTIEVAEVETIYYLAWKDGIYRFEDEPLESITGLLAKRFDLDIRISAPLREKRFTGRVTSEDDIRSVLSTLGKSYPLEYRITGRIVEISEP